MTYSIRVINYFGDMDDLNDLIAIGNYPTKAARDADIRRLGALPDVYDSAELLPSNMDAHGNGLDARATPAQVADVTNLDGLVKVLYDLPDVDL